MSFRICLVFVTAVLLTACSTLFSPDKTAAIDDTDWVLATLPGRILVKDSVVTLQFEDGRVSGTDGCNRYSGAYTAADLQLQFDSNMATTMMACAEPVMQQAGVFMANLAQVRSYRIAAGQLVLLSADDVLLASFAPQGQGQTGTAVP